LDIVVLEGSDAPQLDQGQRDKEARWDDFNKRVRAGTQEFAKMPVLQSCLAITRQSMIPHIRLTSKLLNLNSEDWCREAFSASFRSQPRYRVLDCASGRHTASFFDDFRMRMRQAEFWESVPLEERSLMTSGLAFRLLSRGAGSVTLYLAQAHRQYPFKLFLAVLGEDEGKVSEVHHDPECTRDRFAKAHCKEYNTVEKLKSFESKLELKCTAVLARTDIVPCEQSHSGLRRTTLRGLQTWRRTLLQCSADVFLATQRRREAPCRSSKGGVKRARRRMKLGLKPPSQKPRAKKYRAKMAAKGRSGRQGVKNAWNVFWREQQVGLQGLPTKRRRQEMKQSYHALPLDELQRLKREARAWTQRARGLLDPAAAEIVARQNLAAKGILAGPDQAAEVVLPADIARRQEDRPISQTIQQKANGSLRHIQKRKVVRRCQKSAAR
jgi:hypothetical protein